MSDFAQPTGIQWNGDVGTVEYGGGDRNLIVAFYNKPVHSKDKSSEAGRPVYEDVVCVRIHPPGERLNIVDRPATGNDARRFPQQWQQFQTKQQQTPEGTPVDLLYPDRPAVGATLRAHAVYTVEQLADLSGHALDTIGMGSQEWCNNAKKYLEAANKGVSTSKFRQEMEIKDREIRVLTKMVDDLKATVQGLERHALGQSDLAMKVQRGIAAQMGQPQHMPNASFDPQLGMINANSPSTDVARSRKRVAIRRK
jgi:hypothetical protein